MSKRSSSVSEHPPPGSGPGPSPPPDDPIETFLAADDRERKRLLRAVLTDTDRATAARLAPALRGKSPRVAARITSLLARHGLEEEFERQLIGLRPGKIDLLRGQFRRIAERDSPAAADEGP